MGKYEEVFDEKAIQSTIVAPYGRLHWATIVAYFVRWPHRGPSSFFTVFINNFHTLTNCN
jgi:hypothetical protein